jgi:hypothetical protein
MSRRVLSASLVLITLFARDVQADTPPRVLFIRGGSGSGGLGGGRALGLNLELAFLRELTSADEKVRHFRRFLDDLEMRGRIRFYEESLFIMNE